MIVAKIKAILTLAGTASAVNIRVSGREIT
jgi:hypothetical protein